MKKTMIRSTMLLIFVSLIAKILSFVVRIMLARTLSEQAMSYYTLAAPTMVFVITLAQMGIPSALSKVIAQSNAPMRSLKASILLSLVNNLLIAIAFLILLPFLAHYILKQDRIAPVLYAILPLLPCVSISGLLKGYLYGIQHHIQATSSQLFEESARILFLFIMFSTTNQLDAQTMAKIAMLSISVGEIVSALYMLLAMRLKKRSIQRIPLLFSNLHRKQFDEVLRVCIPMTGSRLIGSLTYFLEPIVMVIGLSSNSCQHMVEAYGQLNGYVLPLITMPSFITVTLSNVLLPSFTYYYARGNIQSAKKMFNVIIGFCILVGFCCSFICYVYAHTLFVLFYHHTHGVLLLKQLAWPFALFAIQAPLSSMLHALSLSKKSMLDTLAGSVLRIACVYLLTPIIAENALLIGIVLGMLVTTIAHAIRLAHAFYKDAKNPCHVFSLPS